mgnify:CR=1 FL=1
MYAEKTDYDNIEMSSRLQNILKNGFFFMNYFIDLYLLKKIYICHIM